MSDIKNVFISDDINTGDNKLSFRNRNTIEYEFDEMTDKYCNGTNKPVLITGTISLEELEKYIDSDAGYIPKTVARENLTFEIYSPNHSQPIHMENINVYYIVQTRGGGSGTGEENGGSGNGGRGGGLGRPERRLE